MLNRRMVVYLAVALSLIILALFSRIVNNEMYFKIMVTLGCIAASVGLVSRNRRKKSREYVTVGIENKENFVPGIDFNDVAANEEALGSLMGIVDYLRESEKYIRCGARMPKGILLYGPPGTGKTLLAKALAGEAKVPYIAVSGSDFVQMYVGVGAGRIREIFKKARKAGKCVIFIDEIDALGKRRNDSASDERDQTLNALLSEMSGFNEGSGIIVVAATNRKEVLDPALLRPGRFDRCIEVGLPDKTGRLEILKLHSRNKNIDGDVDLMKLAEETCSFSGAALETLLNEAAIISASRGGTVITADDVEKAYINTVAGEDRRSVALPEEKFTIALHEAGHAVVSRILLPENRIKRISILPSGNSMAGYNLSIPGEKTLIKRRDMENQIAVLFGGRAAELLINGVEEMTSGASGDLAKAAEMASIMVVDLGMGKSPEISYRALGNMRSAAGDAEAEIRQILGSGFEKARKTLEKNKALLMVLTEKLLENEVLREDDINEIFEEMDT